MTALQLENKSVELSIKLRYAQKSDLPKLEWHGQYSHYRDLFRRAYREQLSGKRLMLIADCNGFPIGQLFIQLKSTNTRIADGKERAYLYSFRVMDLFRGRGIGTRLLQTAELRLAEWNFIWCTIAVSKTNDDALRLYERFQYVRFADDAGRWSYTDQYGKVQHVIDPCWILEKRLGVR